MNVLKSNSADTPSKWYFIIIHDLNRYALQVESAQKIIAIKNIFHFLAHVFIHGVQE